MNAYELAKKIVVKPTIPIDIEHLDLAATMLRQQADRISELEKALSRALDLLEANKGEVNE